MRLMSYPVRTLSLPCVKREAVPYLSCSAGKVHVVRLEAKQHTYMYIRDLVSSSLVYTVFVSKASICAFN